ncbi:MAG: NADH:ubiquinone oxidoreductase, partial [Candidatus Competibacterales bacterium]
PGPAAEEPTPPQEASPPIPGAAHTAGDGPNAAPSAGEGEGKTDDLQAIRGVGPTLARWLYSRGISSFRQLATLTEADVNRLEAELLRFRGRVRREDWIGQAKALHFDKYGERL